MQGDKTKPIGFIVEGESEYRAVPTLAKSLGVRHATPAKLGGQGAELSPNGLAKQLLPVLRTVISKGLRKVIVLLDREQRPECAGQLAHGLLLAIEKDLPPKPENPPIAVVIADRMFENWLLADIDGIRRHSALKEGRPAAQRPNADGFDGKGELKGLFSGNTGYVPGQMTADLAAQLRIDDADVQQRSKSLRKFVKELRS